MSTPTLPRQATAGAVDRQADAGMRPAAGDPLKLSESPPARAHSSLKRRLSILLTALSVVTFLFALAAYLLGARHDIGRESRAAERLAQALLASQPQIDGVPAVSIEAVDGLAHLRHLRLTAPDGLQQEESHYPKWFARLFDGEPVLPAIPIMITRGGSPVGMATLVPVPDDEIEEKWRDVCNVAGFALVLLALLNLGAWMIVRAQLRPLEQLRMAFDRISLGQHDVQFQSAGVAELATVELGFNRMAQALSAADGNNRRLMRELLRVQEEERHSIARELHDEFAQQATAIDAESVALLTMRPEDSRLQAGIASIRHSARALMRLVRSRLQQLRPELLDEFGIVAALEELCRQFEAAHPALELACDCPPELNLGEEHAIALFRLVQESLTNVARHAQATRVEIELALTVADGRERLSLQVSDDGIGLPPGRSEGFGILGMRERVESLGGSLELGTGLDRQGLSITAIIPLSSIRWS